MDVCCRKVKFAGGEQGGRVRLAHVDTAFSGKERTYPRNGIVGDVGDFSLGDDLAAGSSGIGAHFDQPVCFGKNLCVVIDQYHGVAVGDQILHDAGQSGDVGWVQSDGWFVQYVKHTGCAVADGACQLHALPFACGKCGCGAIQRQIAKPYIEQKLQPIRDLLDDEAKV